MNGRFDTQPAARTPGDAGFSLIEAVIAAGMVATLAAGVAQVFGFSARAIHVARVRTLGAVLAAQKMEQLQSLTLAHLNASPPGSLDADVPFYVDYADSAGTIVGSRDAAAYVRRWAVTPVSFDPGNMLMLSVRVLTIDGLDARLASIKARRP